MTSKSSRTGRVVLGALLALFGFLCLNYTNGSGSEHHAEWAAAHGLPAPSHAIFIAGAALGALGSGLVGHAIGRRSAP
jgi:hypothetical protein